MKNVFDVESSILQRFVERSNINDVFLASDILRTRFGVPFTGEKQTEFFLVYLYVLREQILRERPANGWDVFANMLADKLEPMMRAMTTPYVISHSSPLPCGPTDLFLESPQTRLLLVPNLTSRAAL